MSVARSVLFALATSGRFERLVRGTPGLGQRAYGSARSYVAGTSREDAVEVARRLDRHGIATSLDFFGEQVSDAAQASAVTAAYVELARSIEQLPDSTWLAVDLSHVGLDVATDVCRGHLRDIVSALPSGRQIQVGAEDSSRTERILEVVLAMASEGAPVMATVQANLRRSAEDAERLTGADVPIRLVKGAYVEPPHLAHRWGEPTDVAYLRLAHRLHAAGASFSVATHDPVIREALLEAFGLVDVEMLLGVRSDDALDLVRRGVPLRLYVPYGSGWFRYWMRRVAESRGA
jgi:proline dehydrogenase